jgi:hypothetical protein
MADDEGEGEGEGELINYYHLPTWIYWILWVLILLAILLVPSDHGHSFIVTETNR